MPRYTAVLMLLLAVALAACGKESNKSTSPPNTPTMPAVITKIVTPRPTSTPLPTPTLPYDLVPVTGRWTLRIEIKILDSAFVDELRYSTVADLRVNLDGTVSGSGHFSQNINDVPCNARVLDDVPLGFTFKGTTRPEGEDIWADIQLLPDDPNQAEHYTVICPDFNDVRDQTMPVLWPVLRALNRTTWSFPVHNNESVSFQSDLAQETSGAFDGTLTGTVQLNRN